MPPPSSKSIPNLPEIIVPISDWQFREVVSPSAVPVDEEALSLVVPVFLPDRRIYLYNEVILSSAVDYVLYSQVNLFRLGRLVGRFPAHIGDVDTTATITQSLASLFNAGGSPVGDSLSLRLAAPFAGGNITVVVQPLRVSADIDKVTWSLLAASSAVTGYRAYLGVLSTRY